MTNLFMMLFQTILLVALTPLLVGILRKFKAFFRGKRGNRITQMYYDLWKLLQKDRIISKHSSFVTAITPVISLSSVIVASFFVPVFYVMPNVGFLGDFILVIYLIGIVKFLNSHSGLDASSTFGGMGGSREMFISMLAEPTIFLSFVFVFLKTGSLNLHGAAAELNGGFLITPAGLAAIVGFFIIILMENARVPVDNPETHLELTMVHEGMLLEYSGRDLALIDLGAAVKLVVFSTIFANLFIPGGLAVSLGFLPLLIGLGIYLAKIIGIFLVIAILEVWSAKYRVFRMADVGAMAVTSMFLAVVLQFVARG